MIDSIRRRAAVLVGLSAGFAATGCGTSGPADAPPEARPETTAPVAAAPPAPDFAAPDTPAGRAVTALRAKGFRPPRPAAGRGEWAKLPVEALPILVAAHGKPDLDSDDVPVRRMLGLSIYAGELGEIIDAVATEARPADAKTLFVRRGAGTALARGILDARDRNSMADFVALGHYLNDLTVRHVHDLDFFAELPAALVDQPADLRGALLSKAAGALAASYGEALVAVLLADPTLDQRFYQVGTVLSPVVQVKLSPFATALTSIGPDAAAGVRGYVAEWIEYDAAQGFPTAKSRNVHAEFRYRFDRLLKAIESPKAKAAS